MLNQATRREDVYLSVIMHDPYIISNFKTFALKFMI